VPRVRVQVTIDAPRPAVWDRLADIPDHVRWMADARAIRFTGDRRRGVGTAFECETRIGPLRTTDVMEVTEWREGRSLGVRHVGLVSGAGRFVLRRARRGRTRVTWDERLRFPWWLGGPAAGLVAAPVLRLVWRGNLRRLADLVQNRGDG
jgi:Polyketide cyclase / dehydrase and lipid transport